MDQQSDKKDLPNINAVKGSFVEVGFSAKDDAELMKKKQLADQLVFQVSNNNELFNILPDSNRNGEITKEEIQAILESEYLQQKLPENLVKQFSAMIDPSNPSAIVNMDAGVQEPRHEMTNIAPVLNPRMGENPHQFKAREKFQEASIFKVPTSPEVGNRYINFDKNRDRILSVGELKERLHDPNFQWNTREKYMMQIDIAHRGGHMTTSESAQVMSPMSNISELFRRNLKDDPVKFFEENNRLPDAEEKFLSEKFASAMADNTATTNDKLVVGEDKLVGMVATLRNFVPATPIPEPTAIEQFSSDTLKESRKAIKEAPPKPKFVRQVIPTNIAQLKLLDSMPVTLRAENETIEDFMARQEFVRQTVIPVANKFVDFDNNGDGVLKQQEVMDNLNVMLKGHRLAEYLPEETRTHFRVVANNQHIEPASVERLKEVMNTKLFDVKEGASNEAYLKVQDVNSDGQVTIGELKWKQQPENSGQTTAQTSK